MEEEEAFNGNFVAERASFLLLRSNFEDFLE